MIRRPAVSGQFYYSNALKLKKQVGEYITENTHREWVIGIVSPHAGLMYSGHVAGALYSSIKFPDTFILIGPNHTGLGRDISIMSSGQWEMPSGVFAIDEGLGRKIMEKISYIYDDAEAHIFEHSLEVQLPFISYFSDSVKIVPIVMGRASLQQCGEIGACLAEAIKESGYEVVIAASSDMSHYVHDSTARRLDSMAIQEIVSLNPEGLYNIIKKEHISMCGYLPVTAMLYAAKALGAKEARLIKYATSGDISGDYEQVVGYAGIIIK